MKEKEVLTCQVVWKEEIKGMKPLAQDLEPGNSTDDDDDNLS